MVMMVVMMVMVGVKADNIHWAFIREPHSLLKVLQINLSQLSSLKRQVLVSYQTNLSRKKLELMIHHFPEAKVHGAMMVLGHLTLNPWF